MEVEGEGEGDFLLVVSLELFLLPRSLLLVLMSPGTEEHLQSSF